jgi:hypothetical protein
MKKVIQKNGRFAYEYEELAPETQPTVILDILQQSEKNLQSIAKVFGSRFIISRLKRPVCSRSRYRYLGHTGWRLRNRGLK